MTAKTLETGKMRPERKQDMVLEVMKKGLDVKCNITFSKTLYTTPNAVRRHAIYVNNAVETSVQTSDVKCNFYVSRSLSHLIPF